MNGVCWEDRVFLTATTTDETGGRVLCIDRDSGKILWDKTPRSRTVNEFTQSSTV
jgi:hypothetical protein